MYSGKYRKYEAKCWACNCSDITGWVHAKCGGRMEINEYAYERCDKCDTKALTTEWLMQCKFHSENYQKIDLKQLLHGVAIITSASTSAGADLSWGLTLSKSLSKIVEDEIQKGNI